MPEVLPLQQALSSGAPADFIVIPAARYRFDFLVASPVRLPDYAGSTIRGAFGRALRRIACMTDQKECRQCPLYRSCPYTAIFETPPPEGHDLQKFSQIPNPYVIEPPQWGRRVVEPGENISFNFVLYGRSRSHLPLVIYAMQKAFAYDVGHGRASLVKVAVLLGDSEETIYEPQYQHVKNHENNSVIAVSNAEEVTVQISTPLRLQKNGKPLGPEEISSHAFLMTLLRRFSLLEEFQNGSRLELDFTALSAKTRAVPIYSELVWQDWTRFSSRQNQKMSLGGVVGALKFRSLPPEFRMLLAAGQLTHLGKNSSFGLGKYLLKNGC